jgi:hypothetical protein
MRIPFVCLLAFAAVLHGQTDYKIYAGSTHAHTSYTWSHGEHLGKTGCAGILVYARNPVTNVFSWSDGYVKSQTGCAGIFVIDGAQIPGPDTPVKPDWEKFQGPPVQHYELAKANGYDFYAATDHSQESAFQTGGAANATWMSAKQQAIAVSDSKFVALPGFEFSENDGPGGTGHINVLNTDGILNALAQGIDLPYFYKWLASAKPFGEGPVVASFNHPGPDQYGKWANRDAAVTDVITMLEVINSNNKIHYPAFIQALDHGWKVSPVCGNDNHGIGGISKQTSRTFVLATERTKGAILQAMKNRRTYASLDRNLQARYSVNGAIMGSTLKAPTSFQFEISISDPDTGNPNDRITKIDIVKDGGAVVKEYSPKPEHSVRWTPTVEDASAKYFFVRVWTAGGGDAPGADAANPVAWLAPVWTGR